MENAACMRERTRVYKVLEGKHEGERRFGTSRCRWKGNIKMEIHKIGLGLATD
jgi:hypothetical protein